MTRVLFIVSSSIRGGAQISLFRLISRLDAQRFSIALFCPRGFLADEAKRLGLDVHTIDFNVFGVISVSRFIRRNRIDVVNTVLLGAAVAAALAMLFSWTFPRLAVTVNNAIKYPGMSRWRRATVGLAYRFINCLGPIYLAKSNAVKEELLGLVDVCSQDIFAIPNPVIFESLPSIVDRPRIRNDMGIKEGEIAIGVIGALVPQKGHCYLIEASKSIIGHNPNVHFYFVGDGPERRKLERLSTRFGEEHFTFLGELKDGQHCALAMDIVVVPSIFEGLPNALLEALAVARPVVATTVGGIKEVIRDGENGLLVRPGDAESLANAVTWLLDNPANGAQMGQCGEKTIHDNFNIDAVVKRIGTILEATSRCTHIKRSEDEENEKRHGILILISSSDIGGAQTHVEWLAKGLLGHDAMPIVVCPSGPLLNRLISQGSPVYALDFSLFSWIRIAAIIRRHRPRVVHLHLLGAALYGTIASLLAPGAGLVYTVHNLIVYPGMDLWKRFSYPLLTQIISSKIDAFIAVSNEIREFLVNSSGVSLGKVHLIHNGISFAALEEGCTPPNEILRETGIPTECPVIGSVGRITFQKGYDVLVRSFNILAGEFPTLQCIIVGDGESRAEIESLIQELGLQERMHLVGFQQGVLSWYRCMDIVVFPSRFEGLPITVIEAAYAGRPIVASDVGGVAEILRHEVSGLLVPCDDVPTLTSQVRRLLLDSHFATTLSKQARAIAVDRFDVSNCSEKTKRIYGKYRQ